MTKRGSLVPTSKMASVDKNGGVSIVDHSGVRSVVKATIASGGSNIIDGFEELYRADHDLLRPIFDPATLCTFSYNSDAISQCVRTLAVNIDFTGHTFKFRSPIGATKKNPTAADIADRKRLEMVFQRPNPHSTFRTMREELRNDKSYIGNRGIEVVRNLAGEIVELYRVPMKWVRMTKPFPEPVEVTYSVRLEDGEWEEKTTLTKFRRYCQKVGNKQVWFKAFGDPRSLNKETGEFAKGDAAWPIDKAANELLFDSYASNNTVYGEPPWISEIISIVGAKLAKDVNYLYFDNKGVPQFAILISGGYLPTGENGEDPVEKIQEYIEHNLKGVENFHKTMILQAAPFTVEDAQGGEKAGQVKIDIKPLAQYMQKDALFQDYIKNTTKSVQRKWRISSALFGGSDEFSHAAVKEAKTISEQQVFSPERSSDDEMYNQIVLAMGIRNWQFVSLPLAILDDVEILAAIAPMSDLAPVGPIVRMISGLLGEEPPELDEEVKSMLFGEYKQKFLPVFDPLGFGPEPEPGNPGANNTKILAKLRLIRSEIAKRHS